MMAFAHMGVELIALRTAGFDNVNLEAARAHGITVARAPAYSPHAVAEHAFALLLSLNRKVHLAYERVRRGNFTHDGLMGFDLVGKTVGIVGVGNIGSAAARIARGFGCEVLGADPVRREDCRGLVDYVGLDELLERSDIISLHCPLNDITRHLIGSRELARMKHGALLINTSRGAVIDTQAILKALEDSRLGGLAMDVYEREAGLFFQDHSGEEIQDKQFVRLLAFPNVLITPHQAFLTGEALAKIASTTIENIDAFERTGRPLCEVLPNEAPVIANAFQTVEA
jgi:D-lactate dehydrogenase